MEHSEDKMLIEGDELGPVLHGLGCDPDIIGRERRALTFELQGEDLGDRHIIDKKHSPE
jgi:hypothetical protein